MNACYDEVTDEDGFLSGSMIIKSKNSLMKERIWINRGALLHSGGDQFPSQIPLACYHC